MEIIGIHTPETDAERVTANVVRHTKKWGITYPILIDTQGANWNNWGQQYWPTVYLVDKQGTVRYRWAGELAWQGAPGERLIADKIQELLKEEAP